MSENEKKDKTLVEQHALKRLHKVEKEQRKPYAKQSHHFSWQQFIMIIIFLIVLVIMLSTLF
ncbi:hypothetical protein [Limosilactobacillus agrestis]|uniref:hypothetical protein n=1 Tax=Limosilactobacillus agrestis TaxID=2759748 RepID=UPI001E5D5574|nr:hypothetical protein [Limosilactobacillus agrestis]MCD7112038.1 hypothetical protein [Limosilactobacillus agrestis]